MACDYRARNRAQNLAAAAAAAHHSATTTTTTINCNQTSSTTCSCVRERKQRPIYSTHTHTYTLGTENNIEQRPRVSAEIRGSAHTHARHCERTQQPAVLTVGGTFTHSHKSSTQQVHKYTAAVQQQTLARKRERERQRVCVCVRE